MSTYLTLCQQTHRLIRAGNNTPGSQPTTVVGNTDPLLLDIVYFVNEAWQQIQNDNTSWTFMRNQAILQLPINTSTTSVQELTNVTIVAAYPLWRNLIIFNAAQYNYALIYDPNQVPLPVSQLPIYFIPWNEFRGFFDRSPRQSGQPIRFSEDPQFNLWFDPPPLGAPSNPATTPYSMACDYRRTNQVLAVDTDVPLMLADYHDLIVYWAGVLYCQTRSNTSALMGACESNVSRIMAKVQSAQIPVWVIDDRYA